MLSRRLFAQFIITRRRGIEGLELQNLTNIEQTTAEIILKTQTAQNIIEIGKRLIMVKGSLAHGEWLPYLRDRVALSARTLSRFMTIVREYSPALADLN